MASVGGVEVLTGEAPVSWGDFSIVDVTWKSLSWMVEHLEFDWVVFLSEQDYPIAPLDKLEATLAASGADAFIHARTLDRIEDADLRMDCDRRYHYQYTALPRPGLMARLPPRVRRPIADAANYANFVVYKLQRKVTVYRYPDPLPMRLGVRPKRSPFSSVFPCWYGSQWMALSRRAAQTVDRFVEDRADYVRYYAKTVIPDESATATIVCNDPTLAVRDEHLHYVRFSANDGHPDVFGLDDTDELVGTGRFFARKFDVDIDSGVLDALDRHIFG